MQSICDDENMEEDYEDEVWGDSTRKVSFNKECMREEEDEIVE